MASSEKDEHESLKNELIFLTKLLHQHKKNTNSVTGTHHHVQTKKPSHNKVPSTLLPPRKKDMVWRRLDTRPTSTNKNVNSHNSSLVKHKTLPSNRSKGYTKVNSFKTKSSTAPLLDDSPLLSSEKLDSSKYAQMNHFSSKVKLSTNSNKSSLKTQHSGKYTKVNSSINNQSSLKDSVMSGNLTNASTSSYVSVTGSTTSMYRKEMQRKVLSSNELTRLSSNKLIIRKRSNNSNRLDRSKSTQDGHETTILYNHLNSPTKQIEQIEEKAVSKKTIQSLTSSPKNSPNSKYVWKNDKYQENEPLVKNAKQLTFLSNFKVDHSKSPNKHSSSHKNNLSPISKYKLHRGTPTSTLGKKVKFKLAAYPTSKVYKSPNMKRKKLLPQTIKKTPKTRNSKHKWVCKSSESSLVKKKPTFRSNAGKIPASKSKYTWKKGQKTKEVSVCGYKLTNISKTPTTPRTIHLPFMERRKKYVNSHTPVLHHSRFKIRKKRLPILSPSWDRTPLSRTVKESPSALFTLKKTKRKIIRKHKISSTSVNHLDMQETSVTPISSKNDEFKISSSGKKLKRLKKPMKRTPSRDHTSSISPVIATKRFISSRKLVAQQALYRSIVTSNQVKYKKHNKASGSKQYCTYYNRFGKCKRGDKCQYLHDPEKVAVCTRFLRGKCKQTDGSCPFSHKISKEKMPVCSFFLGGICNRDNCPYLHVNVSRKAAICQDFLRGYCPEGDKCKKKHSLDCPDYQRDGNCPRGRQCRLIHHQVKGTKRKAQKTEHKSKLAKNPKNIEIADDVCVTTVQNEVEFGCELPSFISLNDTGSDWFNTPNTSIQDGKKSVTPELLIRPKFTSKE